MTTTASPLRLGVLGAANIARQFVAGVRGSSRVSIAVIGSRDAAKGAAFAAEVGVPRSHGSYEALLADPEIDAIYLPLPNGLHAEWAVKALQAGKHVLCEKPLAITEAEAARMFAAARAAGRVLVEAYPYLAQPQTIQLRELAQAGAFGRLRVIQASFGFTLPQGRNVRLEAGIGGGAILDAGSYPVSLVRVLAGCRPVRVTATALMGEGVDLTTWASIDFPDGLVAQVTCSFGTAFHRHALIVGEGGVARTTFLNHPPIGGPGMIEVKRGAASPNAAAPQGFETIATAETNGFLAEAESFAALVAGEGGWTGVTDEESIDIAATLEAMRESVRQARPIALSPASPARG